MRDSQSAEAQHSGGAFPQLCQVAGGWFFALRKRTEDCPHFRMTNLDLIYRCLGIILESMVPVAIRSRSGR